MSRQPPPPKPKTRPLWPLAAVVAVASVLGVGYLAYTADPWAAGAERGPPAAGWVPGRPGDG